MTMNTWKNRVDKGENRKTEFKVDLPGGSQLSKTAVAFANGAGGDILIGVSDQRELTGLSDEKLRNYPDRISGMIFDAISPSLIPEMFTVTIDNTTVLVIRIQPGHAKPYYLQREGSSEGVYIRVGSTNKRADRTMLIELARQAKGLSFDEEPAYDLPLDGFDISAFASDYQHYTHDKLTQTALENLRLVKPIHEVLHATRALQILTGSADFEYARIQCALFKGNTPLEFIDRKENAGSLLSQIEGAMQFLKQHIPLSGRIEGIQRIDRYEISMIALREAVVNAVVHRDYSISGSDIKVAIFDDRVEITSPGCLPNTLDISEIGTGRSEIRNHMIAGTLKRMGIIEQWGTGTAKMVKECGETPPVFRETGHHFKVVFERPFNAPKADDDGVTDGVHDIQTRLLSTIKRHPGLRSNHLAQKLSLTQITTERNLRKLKRSAQIAFNGAPKTGGYYVVEQPPE
jgi:ATP-dependent DNA helicase RecG